VRRYRRKHMDRQAETKLIPWETRLRYDVFVIGLFAVALIAGWGLKSWAEAQATTLATLNAALSLRIPASWAPQAEKGALLSIRDLQSEGTFKTTFSVTARELEPAAIKPVRDLVEPFTAERAQDLAAYRVFETSDTEVDGLEAVRISYTYEDEPTGGPFQTSVPVVVQGVDVLVTHGSNLYVLTFAAPATTFSQQAEIFDGILDSVNLEE
jgi:hypothetical protein